MWGEKKSATTKTKKRKTANTNFLLVLCVFFNFKRFYTCEIHVIWIQFCINLNQYQSVCRFLKTRQKKRCFFSLVDFSHGVYKRRYYKESDVNSYNKCIEYAFKIELSYTCGTFDWTLIRLNLVLVLGCISLHSNQPLFSLHLEGRTTDHEVNYHTGGTKWSLKATVIKAQSWATFSPTGSY